MYANGFLTIKTSTTKATSGISLSSVNTSTAGFPAEEQAFELLTDLDSDKNPTGVYHTVTIEAFTEGNPSSAILFPIEVKGHKKWVSSITVKEAPTAVKSVINTFLPKKLTRISSWVYYTTLLIELVYS